MSDERSITRRMSLKGIAGTGALLVGTGLGSNTVSAVEELPVGVEEIAFEECHSVAMTFAESFIAPADDGTLTLPIEPVGDDALFIPISSTTDDALTIPTADETDTALAVAYTSLSSTELVLPVVDDSGMVENTYEVTASVLETRDDGIVVPADSTHAVALEDGGVLNLSSKKKNKGDFLVELANGSAVFTVEGGDADGADLVSPVVREHDGYVTTVEITTYNAARSRPETVARELTIDDLQTTTLTGGEEVDDVIAWTFSAFQFYDRPVEAGDQVLAVTVNGETIENPNECGGSSHSTGGGAVSLEDVSLTATCTDPETDLARYVLENENPDSLAFTYVVEETERVGTVSIPAESATYLDVLAPDGETTLALLDDDEEVLAAVESNDEVACLPRGESQITYQCANQFEATGEFTVTNGTDDDRTYTYYVAETGESGLLTVEDSVSSTETLTVSAPDAEATVGLYYEGVLLDSATLDPDQDC